jgi:hypothetical protein
VESEVRAELTGFQAALRVFRTSGLGPLMGRKGILLILLAALPMVMMVAGRIFGADRGTGLLFFLTTLAPFYHYINLIVFIFLGCSALGESIEDKTLTYDLACPLPRFSIFAGRYLSYGISSLSILLPSLWGAYLICMAPRGIDAVTREFAIPTAMTIMTVAATGVYGSLFILLSLQIKRAVLLAILLMVGLDGVIAYLPLKISSLSILVHLRNLMSTISGERRFRNMLEDSVITVEPGYSLLVLICLWLLFTVVGAVIFRGKQFP